MKFSLFFLLFYSSSLFAQQTSAEVEDKYGWLFGKISGTLFGPLDRTTDSIQHYRIKTVVEKSKDASGKTSEVCNYNSRGQLTERIANNWGTKFSESYSYSSNGKLLTVYRYMNKKLTSIDSSFYDGIGNCTGMHSYDLQNNSSQFSEMTYDAAGRVLTMNTVYSTGWTEHYYYTHDRTGQQNNATRVSISPSGKSDTTMRCIITRDDNDRIISIHQFDKNSGILDVALDSKNNSSEFAYQRLDYNFTYDDHGLVIKKLESVYRSKTLSIFSYDAQQRLQTEQIIQNDKDTVIKTHYYSASSHTDSVVMPYRNSFDNALTQVEVEVNKYDDKGRKIQFERFSGSIGDLTPLEKQQWKYDEEGHLIEIRFMSIDINSTDYRYEAAVTVEYRYDKNGLVTDWYKIDKKGKKEYSYTYSYIFYK